MVAPRAKVFDFTPPAMNDTCKEVYRALQSLGFVPYRRDAYGSTWEKKTDLDWGYQMQCTAHVDMDLGRDGPTGGVTVAFDEDLPYLSPCAEARRAMAQIEKVKIAKKVIDPWG